MADLRANNSRFGVLDGINISSCFINKWGQNGDIDTGMDYFDLEKYQSIIKKAKGE